MICLLYPCFIDAPRRQNVNKLIATAALVLATTAIPAIAAAQVSTPAPTIVVTGKYQKSWNKGSSLEAEGIRDMEKAKKELVRYSADVVNAQNKRDSARARAENAADEFRNLTAAPIYFSDAEEAVQWARRVEKASSDWAKFDARRGDGRAELDKAMTKQRRAQQAVDKAQAMIDQGRTMKTEAERLSMLGAQR
jgi:hypothetical protein